MYKKNPNVLKQGSNFLMIPIQDQSILLYRLTSCGTVAIA